MRAAEGRLLERVYSLVYLSSAVAPFGVNFSGAELSLLSYLLVTGSLTFTPQVLVCSHGS
jgi:hypothetical protein